MNLGSKPVFTAKNALSEVYVNAWKVGTIVLLCIWWCKDPLARNRIKENDSSLGKME